MAEGITRRQFVRVAAITAGTVAVGGGAYAVAVWAPTDDAEAHLRVTMGVGMSKVLVVYGTRTGCTAGVASKIAETLSAKGATVDVKSAADKPDPSAYDAVVVGSGIRMSNWHAPVKEWVAANADALKARPTAFFTACLTMATNPEKVDEVRAYTDPLTSETGVKPVDLGLFAGMNVAKKFSLPERLVMKMMKAPEGDFRDLAAVAAWAESAAPKLGLA